MRVGREGVFGCGFRGRGGKMGWDGGVGVVWRGVIWEKEGIVLRAGTKRLCRTMPKMGRYSTYVRPPTTGLLFLIEWEIFVPIQSQ